MIFVGEQCPYCTLFRSVRDMIEMPGGARICVSCQHKHEEALKSIQSGRFLGVCSECGLSAEELRLRKRCGPNGEMAVHYENGKYRAMCLICDLKYVPKRRELYRNTEFGNALKL